VKCWCSGLICKLFKGVIDRCVAGIVAATYLNQGFHFRVGKTAVSRKNGSRGYFGERHVPVKATAKTLFINF
jgi:hypothetical protein